MKLFRQRIYSEKGTATFAVLMICTSMLVCTATMLSVLQIRTQIEANNGMHQVVYNAAKGVALTDMHILSNSLLPVSNSSTVGDVSVDTTVSGTNPITVRVKAAYVGATDTVLFTFDTVSKKVTDWQDNVPPK